MRTAFILTLLLGIEHAYAVSDLNTAIENVRNSCGGISGELNHLKTIAGINTAVTGVGTVAGGVALGTGIAKAKVDKEAAENEELIAALEDAGAVRITSLDMFYETFADTLDETNTAQGKLYATQLRTKKSKLDKKSKNLGNWRTGMLATSTATNIAGVIIAGNNREKGDLKSQIDNCLAAVKVLSNVRMQARISKTATDVELARAEAIVRACDAWSTVDISSINNKSTGAAVSSGVGVATGLAGTIVSSSANSDKVRDGDKDKEKNLNTAANVLAGGTTAASLTATIFNATQIGAIKRAATVADECEGALR